MRSGLAFLLWCGLGLSLSTSCDSLWGSLVKDNPDNCVASRGICSPDQLCSPITERCIAAGAQCSGNPSVCAAAEMCSPDTGRCVSKVVLSGVSPAQGPDGGGGRITITGDFFQNGIAAYFDGAMAGNAVRSGATSLVVDLPPHLRYAGPAAVKLVQLDGSSVLRSDLFSYFLGAPDFTMFRDVPDITAETVVSADFDGDGKLDLAASADQSVFVSLGNGDGTFRPTSLFTTPVTATTAIALSDFNGNQKPDLYVAGITANGKDTTISLFLDNGSGGFKPASNVTISGLVAQGVRAGDFDGDGGTDLLAVGADSTASTCCSIKLLRANGSGGFLAPAALTFPSATTIALVSTVTVRDLHELYSPTAAPERTC